MILRSFLQWTAWPMEPPKPYGAFHLTFLLIGLLVCGSTAFALRHAGERTNKTILLVVGGLLLLSEIYKQLFYTFVIGDGAYQWWIFPFQLCSVPMYLCFLAAFLKNENIKHRLYDFMISFNLFGGFISFLEPSGLCHEYWTLTLHAFCWHMLLVFLGLYLGFSGRGAERVGDFKNAVRVFVALCIVAFAINLLLWRVAEGDINMFYVGPAISPIAVFEQIATRYGWYVNTPLYMASVCLGAFVFYFPFAYVHQRRTAER